MSTYKLNLMDLDKNIYNIPPTEFNTIITMATGEFHKICKDLSMIADTVEIKKLSKEINIYG